MSASSPRSASRRRSTAASSASSASARRLTAASIALCSIIAISAPKNSCGSNCLDEEPYVARDPVVNASQAIYPDVFVLLCMAARQPARHIDSRGSHAIQPTQKAFSMSAKASSTAAVVPAAGHEQAAAAPLSLCEHGQCIRALAMDAVEQAKSGHPGMPMGMPTWRRCCSRNS